MKTTLQILTPLVILSACASVPDVKISYYHSKPNINVTVTQLLTCDALQERIFESARLTTTITHSAGRKADTELRLNDFDGDFRDGDLSFKFFPDGRLKTINANVTGTGEKTINSIASVVGSIFGLNYKGLGPFSGPDLPLEPTNPEIKAICDVINHGNDKKNGIMTLTYSKEFQGIPSNGNLAPDQKSDIKLQKIAKKLSAIGQNNGNLISSVRITFAGDDSAFSPLGYGEDFVKSDTNKYVYLDVQKTQKYTVSAERVFNESLNVGFENTNIPSSTILVASTETRSVPIPKGGAFGTSKFSVILNEMGSIVSIGYNNSNGLSSALDSMNVGLNELQKKTDEEVADGIAQHARRLRCEAAPSECI